MRLTACLFRSPLFAPRLLASICGIVAIAACGNSDDAVSFGRNGGAAGVAGPSAGQGGGGAGRAGDAGASGAAAAGSSGGPVVAGGGGAASNGDAGSGGMASASGTAGKGGAASEGGAGGKDGGSGKGGASGTSGTGGKGGTSGKGGAAGAGGANLGGGGGAVAGGAGSSAMAGAAGNGASASAGSAGAAGGLSAACGDGVRNQDSEQCDGGDFGGDKPTCPAGTSGFVSCNAGCVVDFSCVSDSCGNGVVDAGEECDSENIRCNDCKVLCDFGEKLFQGHCYSVTGADSWEKAQKECEKRDGNLVTIGSAAENAFVYTRADGNPGREDDDLVWVGLSDRSTEATFLWANGESSTFTNYASGEPSAATTNTDCVGLSLQDESWRVLECEGKRRGVCEMDPAVE